MNQINEQTVVDHTPSLPPKNRVLLVDASQPRRQMRASGMRLRGVVVECAGTGDEARSAWKLGSHELVLIEFRDGGADLYEFYRHVLTSSTVQKFGFYTAHSPYITSSFSDRVDEDDESAHLPGGELQSLLHKGAPSARFRGGIPEAARRIAAIRPLTHGASREAGTSFSAAVRRAERILGIVE